MSERLIVALRVLPRRRLPAWPQLVERGLGGDHHVLLRSFRVAIDPGLKDTSERRGLVLGVADAARHAAVAHGHERVRQPRAGSLRTTSTACRPRRRTGDTASARFSASPARPERARWCSALEAGSTLGDAERPGGAIDADAANTSATSTPAFALRRRRLGDLAFPTAAHRSRRSARHAPHRACDR
jgi:hypothetical protein